MSAKRKIEASLPDLHRGQVVAASQRILVRPEGFVRTPAKLDALAPVQQAVFEGRRLRLTYRRRGGEPARRLLDPVGLIVAGDTWYLVAESAGVQRMYRVSRMSEVEVLDDPAQRDPHVDLDEVWERHRDAFRSLFQPIEVVIGCAPGDVEAMRAPVEVMSVTETDGPDHRVQVRMRFGDGGRALRALWLMAFDVDFEIIEPASLRASMRARALGLVTGWPEPPDDPGRCLP